MIRINKLTFGYNKSKLLYEDLSLNLQNGSIYGLLGKNGAGKSTLLKLLTGMLYPKKGEVLVNGFTPQKRLPNFLQSFYFIPEEVDVPPIKIKKYLSLFTPFYPNFNKEQFYSYLNNLEVNFEGKLSDLSFGQQKKFIISFGLACNTPLLILDEPTNGLDIPSKAWFRRLLSMALNEERILIISTHQVRDLENLIDSVIILEEGKILLQNTLEEISEKLVFKAQPEIDPEMEILYSEKSLLGYSYVGVNTNGDETKINLEHLFEASTNSPKRINQIFQTKAY